MTPTAVLLWAAWTTTLSGIAVLADCGGGLGAAGPFSPGTDPAPEGADLRASVNDSGCDRASLCADAYAATNGQPARAGRYSAVGGVLGQQGTQFVGGLVALRLIQALQHGFDPGLPGRLLANAYPIHCVRIRGFECRCGLVQALQLCLLALSVAAPEPPCNRLPQPCPCLRSGGLHHRDAARCGYSRQRFLQHLVPPCFAADPW